VGNIRRITRGGPRTCHTLESGILAWGCLHLVCRSCGHSELVAMSCKRRGFCPSCVGRRMADTAVHLEQRVLPEVPIRHWIGSLPWGLRALLGYDRRLCARVVAAFVDELCRSLRRRAKRLLGLESVRAAHTGAVAAIQRTDGAIRLNVHFHVLAMDGVYVPKGDDGALVFHPLPPPVRANVAEVAGRTCRSPIYAVRPDREERRGRRRMRSHATVAGTSRRRRGAS